MLRDTIITGFSVNFKVKHRSVDSVAANRDAILANSLSGDINISLFPSSNAKIIIKKISNDSNKVIISVLDGGTIDNKNKQEITNENQSYYFLSDGFNFYII